MQDSTLLEQLAGIVGPRHVLTDAGDVAPFVTEHRGRYPGSALAVVKPASTQDVAAIVRVCAQARRPIVPQGGNTGLCGAAAPVSEPAVFMRLDRMNKIREISPFDEAATVEAGCILADIQTAAAAKDLLFPLSLGAEGSCQIGGNIATNAGGIAVLRYGNMRQLVLGLEVVLPDGSVLDGLRSLRKDNAGYDLKQLFIGAEGTLGIVTAAVLKLFPAVKSRCVALLQIRSVEDALAIFGRARRTFGERISSIEIIGSSYMEFVLSFVAGTKRPFVTPSEWYLLLEVGDARADIEIRPEMEELLAGCLDAGLVSDATIAASRSQEEQIWKLRHGVTNEFKRAGVVVAHDSSVPVSRQPEFAARVRHDVQAEFPDANVMMVGHIGDGNIHLVVLFPHGRFQTSAEFDAASDAIDLISDRIVLGMGGSITAEHGVGLTYRKRLAAAKSTTEMALMKSVKRTLDPHNIMNPGKVFSA